MLALKLISTKVFRGYHSATFHVDHQSSMSSCASAIFCFPKLRRRRKFLRSAPQRAKWRIKGPRDGQRSLCKMWFPFHKISWHDFWIKTEENRHRAELEELKLKVTMKSCTRRPVTWGSPLIKKKPLKHTIDEKAWNAKVEAVNWNPNWHSQLLQAAKRGKRRVMKQWWERGICWCLTQTNRN